MIGFETGIAGGVVVPAEIVARRLESRAAATPAARGVCGNLTVKGRHSGGHIMPDNSSGTPSGLTHSEAQEFHRLFMQGTLGFVAVTVLAHLLIWVWRPWF
jgi:light-harvesting complex 1 beta chain